MSQAPLTALGDGCWRVYLHLLSCKFLSLGATAPVGENVLIATPKIRCGPGPCKIFFKNIMHRILLSLIGVAFCLSLVGGHPAQAHEFSGVVAGEVRLFAEDPNFPGQRDQSASFAFEPEYYHEFADGSSFTFVPFFRLDSADSERTHFDVRELTYLWLHEDFELRLGVRKVFWGTTEVLHLVDIINQTDVVENFDGEEKLGQPMANMSVSRDWGTVDLFVLPFFQRAHFSREQGPTALRSGGGHRPGHLRKCRGGMAHGFRTPLRSHLRRLGCGVVPFCRDQQRPGFSLWRGWCR